MDQMLKQRLIGAIVIIALAVIFIPMILEGPDDELSPRTQDMPPPPTIDYQTEVELAVPEESTEPAESLADTTMEQEVSAIPEPTMSQPEPPMSQPEPATIEAEAPAKQTKPDVAKPASPAIPSGAATSIAQGDWILQVGSFSQQANALSLRDRLKKSGYQASVKNVKGAGGTIHRVLVGPVSDRPAAERLRDKLASEQKLTAMVLENK